MTEEDRPQPIGFMVPPPFIFALGFTLGWLVDAYVTPLRFGPPPPESAGLRLTGEVLIILGAILALWAALTFRRARTSVLPFRPASTLVVEGPFRFSRNPMYVGLTAIYIGAALAMNMVWPVVLLPPTLLALYVLVIRREELYLERRFGPAYSDYRDRVRRWV